MNQLQTSKGYFNRLAAAENLPERRRLAGSCADAGNLPELGIIGPSLLAFTGKERQRAARQITEAYRTLDCLPNGVILLDDFGIIEFANLAMSSQLQIPQAEMPGRLLSSILSNIRVIEEIDGDLKFATAQKRDGSTFTVEISESEIELDGQARTLWSLRRVSLQEEFARQHRDFIARIVHELKTPLASFTGILSMMEEGILGELNQLGRKTTARSKQTCKRLVRLVNDMLDLEKLQAGKFMLDCKKLNLYEVLKGVIESAIPLADKRRITLAVARDLCVFADEDRIIQVVLNLVSNAIKNSPDGSIIKVSAETTAEGVIVSIEDQGRGIPEDKLSMIFEAYEQVDILDATHRGGTGLGLPICKSIVEEHGGQIGVTTKLGHGTSFWFTLPESK